MSPTLLREPADSHFLTNVQHKITYQVSMYCAFVGLCTQQNAVICHMQKFAAVTKQRLSKPFTL